MGFMVTPKQSLNTIDPGVSHHAARCGRSGRQYLLANVSSAHRPHRGLRYWTRQLPTHTRADILQQLYPTVAPTPPLPPTTGLIRSPGSKLARRPRVGPAPRRPPTAGRSPLPPSAAGTPQPPHQPPPAASFPPSPTRGICPSKARHLLVLPGWLC